MELNRLFTAWVETEYPPAHDTETGQSPLIGGGRLDPPGAEGGDADGGRSDRGVPWSEYRTVTKTATVSLHGNTFEVDATLIGRRVELVG